jgi:hypothetical protein
MAIAYFETMKIGRTRSGGCWTGLLVCLSLGCSSGGSAADVDGGGADQSTQSMSDTGTAIDATSGDDGQSPPPLTGGGPPDCVGPCCTIPEPGSACDAGDQDASCTTSASCGAANAATLTLPFNLVCNGQHWVAVGGDCGDSGVADNGCPTSQPQNGTACILDSGTSCQYGLQCSGTCDAGSVWPTPLQTPARVRAWRARVACPFRGKSAPPFVAPASGRHSRSGHAPDARVGARRAPRIARLAAGPRTSTAAGCTHHPRKSLQSTLSWRGALAGWALSWRRFPRSDVAAPRAPPREAARMGATQPARPRGAKEATRPSGPPPM